MKFQSMTGFGRGEAADSEYTVTVEVKSVNHRFKELRFRMSSLLNSIELELKKVLLAQFKRGSFDISINFKKNDKASRFADLDSQKIEAFLDTIKKSADRAGVALTVEPTQFLSNDFYCEREESEYDSLRGLVKEALERALVKLLDSRAAEGEKLRKVIEEHRANYISLFEQVKKQTPLFQQEVEARLQKRFRDFREQMPVEESRYMQEIIYYLEKLDITEEISRIESHLAKLDQLICSNGEVGRQIDFLLQELNRETNTIGSKSNNRAISDCIVQMKVELEKIREQGLNIE